jgi:GntR family transcriptional regulator, carbon starvation induced regulator
MEACSSLFRAGGDFTPPIIDVNAKIDFIEMELVATRPDGAGQTLATSIANRLRAEITSGRIPPGDKLHIDDLRATYGVSLSPMREALSRLSAEGFVVMENQRGCRVAPVSENNLREVTKLRSEIESFALRESITAGDDLWESEIVASHYRLSKLEKARPAAGQLAEWEAAHRDVHQRLLSACRMPLLLQFCATLHDLSDRYRRLFLEDRPIDRNVAKEHSDIVAATLERRAEDACRLLRTHIERTGNNVLVALMRKQAG